jgi:hypothetical protein
MHGYADSYPCPANNGSCGQRLWTVKIKGRPTLSLYCYQHTCRRVKDTALCGRQKSPDGKYCPNRA